MLLLASRSPRRADLLRDAGIAFAPGPCPDVDETPPDGSPAEIVESLAERKARAAAPKVPGHTILTADTLVFRDRDVLGKPGDAADATRMLASLAGRTHQVWTGVTLARASDDGVRCLTRHCRATVTFRPLASREIDEYVASGEPLGKAGSYAIQGAAAAFASCSPDERDCVIGLPVELVRSMLATWGRTG